MNLFDNANGVKLVKSYHSLLDAYKKVLEKYQKKVEVLNISEEDKMAAAQVALDLTYLKEELNEMKPNHERLSKDIALLHEKLQEITITQKQIVEKFEGIETQIIEPVNKNNTDNRTAMDEQFYQVMEVTKKKSGGLKILLIISLIFNIIITGGLSVIILYLLDIIRF